jgi:hypothetical protein
MNETVANKFQTFQSTRQLFGDSAERKKRFCRVSTSFSEFLV